MKLKIISDIHTEFDRNDNGKKFLDSIPNKDVDVLIVPGDLTTKYYEENLKQLCDRFPQVVYVLGNHDYWYGSIEGKNEMVANIAAKLSNLHFLNNERKEIGGKFFAGTTLWFPDIERQNMPSLYGWIDCRQVQGGHSAIFEAAEKASQFLEKNVQKGDIVVTHHLPSKQCVADRWMDDEYNCYFLHDVEHVMLKNEPAFWFFGHTHDVRHLMIWKTELLCNPRGYPHEAVPSDLNLTIDTELDKAV